MEADRLRELDRYFAERATAPFGDLDLRPDELSGCVVSVLAACRDYRAAYSRS